MNAPATSPAAGNGLTGERADLLESLERHRGFLLQTVQGLDDERARRRTTVSELTLASLLKHVADTEEQWIAFAVRGAEAFGGGVPDEDVDRSSGEWEDTRFVLSDDETLDVLRARVEQVGARTEEVVSTIDLDSAHDLPVAPWFEPGARWSARRVLLHVLAETSQHAGHADIIREALDGRKTMG